MPFASHGMRVARSRQGVRVRVRTPRAPTRSNVGCSDITRTTRAPCVRWRCATRASRILPPASLGSCLRWPCRGRVRSRAGARARDRWALPCGSGGGGRPARDGERVATLRVGCHHHDPLLNIVELQGAGNRQAPREVWWAARQWRAAHDLLKIDTGWRRWGTAPVDRATWQSLWQPYWIAKRRIPQWLPIAPSRNALDAL